MKSELINYARGLESNKIILEWIEKRISEKQASNISQCEHVIDYLLSKDSPRNLSRATFPQMLQNTEKWASKLIEQGLGIIESDSDTEVILDFKDGFKIVKLIGELSYKREGLLMRHCVASYYNTDKEIFSLRDKDNNPHCTIEKDIQIKGKGNGDIHPKYIGYTVAFLEYSGMQVRESEMEHLGYIVPEFLEHVKNKLFKDRYLRKTEKIKYPDSVIIFTNIKQAVEYKGYKTCLYSGYADFEGSKITSLGKLTTIGGSAYFEGSKITAEQIKRFQKKEINNE